MTSAEVHDSPTGWVNKHINEYVASDGADGHLWNGYPCLLLTVTGRKSGEKRRTALIYGESGDDLVIVASYGGAPKHPVWYLNLEADPGAQVQLKGEVFDVQARTASGEERQRLWDQMVGIYPPYADYQLKTDREIPIVVLSRG